MPVLHYHIELIGAHLLIEGCSTLGKVLNELLYLHQSVRLIAFTGVCHQVLVIVNGNDDDVLMALSVLVFQLDIIGGIIEVYHRKLAQSVCADTLCLVEAVFEANQLSLGLEHAVKVHIDDIGYNDAVCLSLCVDLTSETAIVPDYGIPVINDDNRRREMQKALTFSLAYP